MAKAGDALYLHAGYRTMFPYPNTGSSGASSGVNREPTDGLSPYPTHPYHLADVWRYNISAAPHAAGGASPLCPLHSRCVALPTATGIWDELEPTSSTAPAARADHTLISAGEVLYAVGGYAGNVYFDDTWQFNLSARDPSPLPSGRRRASAPHSACPSVQAPTSGRRSRCSFTPSTRKTAPTTRPPAPSR